MPNAIAQLGLAYQSAIIDRGDWQSCSGRNNWHDCDSCLHAYGCAELKEYRALDQIVTDIRGELRQAQGCDN
ncbi:MAG: hypothetical protein GY841_22120 [FCB group bacterium]|nr:hypothetical protein [FCB group bacterium]